MQTLRRLTLTHRLLAALVVAGALLLRVLVPTGYMLASEQGRITVVICTGLTSGTEMVMETSAMHQAMPDPGKPMDHGKPEMACAFAGLSLLAIGAADPALLLAALAFGMALALFTAPRPRLRAAAFLRPPLRGPPSPALT